jgi:hypothetical protein
MTFIPCQQCGYESPDNAKFCRSCGAALAAENEFSVAATRNYGRQEAAPAAAPAAVQSAPLNPSVVPSVVDAFGEPTARQYAPPPQPATPNVSNTNPFYHAPIAPQYSYAPPPSGKKRRLLKWGAAAGALAFAMGIGAAINDSDNNARLSPEEFALIEATRSEERLNDKLARNLNDASARSKRTIDDLIRQIDSASQEARRTAERGNKANVSGIPLLDLDKYEFDQATVSSAIRIPGKEMRQQFVNSDFGYLVQHYEKLLGKPIVLQNGEDDDEKRALFQSPGTPEQASISVLIKHNDENDRQWEILIVRSPFSFPRPPGAPELVIPKVEAVEIPALPEVPAPPPAAPPVKSTAPKADARSPKN